MPPPPGSRPTTPAAAVRALLEAAAEQGFAVRLHLDEGAIPGGPLREVQGAVRAIVTGRDGRARALVHVTGEGAEQVELRVLLDRVVRAERIASGREASAQTRRVEAVTDDDDDDEPAR
jgi:hypothetical protein